MLNVVTNRLLCCGDFFKRIEKIAMAKPTRIILREKDLNYQDYYEMAYKCNEICKKYKVDLSVNTNIDIAIKLEISSIHLPFNMFLEKGNVLENFKTIGVSIHSIEEAEKAEELGADYLIAGHIFNTECKKNLNPRGLEFFEDICSSVNIDCFAIGGIDENKVNDVMRRGGKGICIMSQFMKCDNPFEKIKEYNKLIEYCSKG